MKRLLWWAGFIWALPISIAGAVLAALVAGKPSVPKEWPQLNAVLREGAILYEAGDWFTRAFFERFGVWAFAWGSVIIFRKGQPLSLAALEHELVHFKQARIFGILLPLAYGVGALVAVAQGKNAYRDNFLERQAREESGR